jgi:hypothetical protein
MVKIVMAAFAAYVACAVAAAPSRAQVVPDIDTARRCTPAR